MIAVIQCAAGKKANAGHMNTRDGKPVLFVVDPSSAPPSASYVYARPDDIFESGTTWRQELLNYNIAPGENPLNLLPAFELYANRAYTNLAAKMGQGNLYILSAGWGLIAGSFLSPNYDITFSAQAEPYMRRKNNSRYNDFCMLPEESKEELVFFGGKSYVPLFCQLTKRHKGPRTIFYNSTQPPEAPGCKLKRFETTTRTNWHYERVSAFLSGQRTQ